MQSRDRILTVSGKFRYEIRTEKVQNVCRLWVNSQDPEKKLRSKSLSLHRLPYTPETTSGIAYNVLAYALCVSACLGTKGCTEKGEKEQVVLNAIHAPATPL